MPAEDRFLLFVRFRATRRNPAGGWLRRALNDGPPVSSAELLLGLALILFSGLGTWYVLSCRAGALALERDPVSVQGKVLDLWVTTGKGAHHHVRYEYSAATDTGPLAFRRKTTLSEKDYRRLEVGGAVTVTYARTNPAYHVIGGAPPPAYTNCWALAAALFILALLAAAGCINLGAWWVARARRGKDMGWLKPW